MTAIGFDYHTHHVRCGHASGDLRDYVESAIRLGMTEIGVSDHAPAYWFDGIDHALPGIQMAVSELPAYVAEARSLQIEYADRIVVRVGIEADFIPGKEAELWAMLSADPFDYVLGSVHYVRGRSVFDKKRWQDENAADTFRAYYELVQDAAQSGMFNILSHLSVIEAYSPSMPETLQREIYPNVAGRRGIVGVRGGNQHIGVSQNGRGRTVPKSRPATRTCPRRGSADIRLGRAHAGTGRLRA